MAPPKGGSGPRSMIAPQRSQPASGQGVNPSELSKSFQDILAQFQQVEQNQKLQSETIQKMNIMQEKITQNSLNAVTLENL
jgi:hypothetical protein